MVKEAVASRYASRVQQIDTYRESHQQGVKKIIMKIEVLERGKKPQQWIKFQVDGVDTAFANALRRVIRSEVPVLAIEYADIKFNSSVVYDEVLSLRLGLVPIVADIDKFVTMDECGCATKPEAEQGCPKCSGKLSLSATGPGMVYSKDLKSASSPKIKPALDTIPIAWLGEGQKIELEAVAILGQGSKHVKWQGAVAAYQPRPKITLTQSKCGEGDCEKCVDACPRGVFSKSGGKIQVKNLLQCNMCHACTEACPNGGVEGALVVEAEPDKFIFYIESFGQRSPEELVLAASKILGEMAEDFKKSLDKVKVN